MLLHGGDGIVEHYDICKSLADPSVPSPLKTTLWLMVVLDSALRLPSISANATEIITQGALCG